MNEVNKPIHSKIVWTILAAIVGNALAEYAPQFDESQREIIIDFINYSAFVLIGIFRVWFTAKRPTL